MRHWRRRRILKGVGVVLQGYNSAEKYELVKELIAPHLNGMFVTPKDIDETSKTDQLYHLGGIESVIFRKSRGIRKNE